MHDRWMTPPHPPSTFPAWCTEAKHKDQDLLVLGWKRFYLNSARGFLVW